MDIGKFRITKESDDHLVVHTGEAEIHLMAWNGSAEAEIYDARNDSETPVDKARFAWDEKAELEARSGENA